uniref:Uncharacterized protein n=1 Tax=Attheya septentrionalis TaxID=420275 RepID=A0A6T7IAS9_9STRA|mmetsp:Transcript_24930/g.45138  ORF Transcript_24930/g.45138 Transcript_24930/m.45138 type:complete len:156 (+) Transcript_24930:145-612(+)|eukprot:CAMPEP_0198284846 /NCGR_PEP_ID=MMETSP1449-20131203/4247_1 /TAXON_ID=420275 /ORGANISM="Attheya septentrionalis, Strain CCMP2084" /LENGTH=155 /DNA_ID=CAMNT_0043982065 /DNA_START=70 /DNA_END=537 /DNA_ORIENTATION=-
MSTSYGTGGAPGSAGGSHHSSSGRQNLNNRFQSSPSSYQSGYQPPTVPQQGQSSADYAHGQSNVMEGTMRNHYEAEGTAATVMAQMRTQRHQLTGAHEDVWEMRQSTEKAKRELMDLRHKVLKKKRRLQAIVVGLAVVDFFLFIRIVKCGGSFFC